MNPISSLGLLAALVFATAVAAGEPPTPRPPIGPRASAMVPHFLDPLAERSPSLPADRIRILNIGDRQLFVAYWDGDSAWKPTAIDAGRSTDISCPRCAGMITVAFHNGRENKQIRAKGGEIYVLSWSVPLGSWVLAASAR
jgi:hypothetical protein